MNKVKKTVTIVVVMALVLCMIASIALAQQGVFEELQEQEPQSIAANEAEPAASEPAASEEPSEQAGEPAPEESPAQPSEQPQETESASPEADATPLPDATPTPDASAASEPSPSVQPSGEASVTPAPDAQSDVLPSPANDILPSSENSALQEEAPVTLDSSKTYMEGAYVPVTFYISSPLIADVETPGFTDKMYYAKVGFSGMAHITVPHGMQETQPYNGQMCYGRQTDNAEIEAIVGEGTIPQSDSYYSQSALAELTQLIKAFTPDHQTVDFGDNVKFRWTVIKYHPSDGWHVDGYVLPVSKTEAYDVTYEYGIVDKSYVQGKPEMNPTEVEVGKAVPLPQVTSDGYQFLGWKYDDQYVDDSFTMPNKNITLIAQWEKLPEKLTVTYDYGTVGEANVDELGKPENNPETVKQGKPVPLPQITADGYDFLGWKYDDQYVDDSFTMPGKNITLVAQWQKRVVPKIELTITSPSQTYTYDGQQHTLSGYTISGGALKDGDVLKNAQGKELTAYASGTNVGPYYVAFNVEYRNGMEVAEGEVHVYRGTKDVTDEYNIKVDTGLLFISSRPLQIKPNGATVNYTGQPQTVTNSVDKDEFTVTGLVSGHTFVSGVTWQVTQTDAGSYTEKLVAEDHVVVKDKNGKDVGGNYSPGGGAATLTINRIPLTVTVKSTSKEYNADNPSFEAELGGLVGKDLTDAGKAAVLDELGLQISCTADKTSLPGEYPITVTGKDQITNYDVTYVNGESVLTVTKSNQLAMDVTPYNDVYDGQAHPGVQATVTTPGATNVVYKYSQTGLAWREELPEFKNVGEYPVWVQATADGYEPVVMTTKAVISKRPVAINANGDSKTYGEADQPLSAQVQGVVAGETLKYQLVREDSKNQNAGSYPIHVVAKPEDNPNYAITTQDAMFDINQAELTLQADDQDRTYGQSVEYTYTAIGLVNGDIKEDIAKEIGAPVLSSIADWDSPADTYDINIAPLDAAKPDSRNYHITYEPGKLTVTESTGMALHATGLRSVYTGEAQTGVTDAGVTIDGVADTADITYSENGLFYSSNIPTFTDAGSYQVHVKATRDGYTEQNTIVNVLIDQAPLTISTVEAGKTYGDDNPPFTVYAQGFVPTDQAQAEQLVANLKVTVQSDAKKNSPVGPYAVHVKGEGTLKNYRPEYTDGVLNVNPKPVDIYVGSASKTYGEADPAGFAALVEGALENDTIAYTVAREQGEDAGNYAIVATPGDNPNYTVTPHDGTFTINQAQLTFTADDAVKAYGEENPGFTFTAQGLKERDTLQSVISELGGLNIGTTATATSPVGTYDITIAPNGGPDTRNYAVSYVNGRLTIGESGLLTVGGTPYNGTYDAEAHNGVENPVSTVPGTEFTYSTDGTNYSPDIPQFTDAGVYPVYIKGHVDGYTDAVTQLEVTIAPKAVTVTVDNQQKVEGTADPQLTATVSGIAGTDTLDYTLAREQGEAVGSYPITATVMDNGNYQVTVVPGTLEITAAPIVAPVTPGTTTPTDTTPGTTTPAAPAGTTPGTTPAAPAGTTTTPAAAAAGDGAGDVTTLPDGAVPLGGGNVTTIGDNGVPLAGASGQASWALLNLLLAIATGIITIVLLIGYFAGKEKKEGQEAAEEAATEKVSAGNMTRSQAKNEKDDENGKLKRKGVLRVLSLIPTIVAVVLFILTENMANPMIFTDKWTIWMGLIAIIQIVLAAFTKKSRKDQEEDGESADGAQLQEG